jgi:hypothetical protein
MRRQSKTRVGVSSRRGTQIDAIQHAEAGQIQMPSPKFKPNPQFLEAKDAVTMQRYAIQYSDSPSSLSL